MTTELAKKAQEIFDHALTIDESEIDNFIESSCGDNYKLLSFVNELLSINKEIEPFTETQSQKQLFNILTNKLLTLDDASLDSFAEGKILSNRYKIIKQIGAGGMGIVYLCSRTGTDYKQYLAIKILRSSKLSSSSVKRFIQEISILSQLKHKNIAHFIDGDFLEGSQPFVVMEYVQGIPINQYCRENRLSVKQRLGHFTKLCSAVEYAHKNLIVHRDIKPNNVLVTEEGNLKLLDFGIAKIVDHTRIDSFTTMTDMHAMTPAYASPEQLLGKHISVASDIYSLGVVLHELLTGKRPFNPKNYTTVSYQDLILNTTPQLPSLAIINNENSLVAGYTLPLTTISKKIYGDLDIIILKCLNVDIDQRYQSVTELIADLKRYSQGLPVLAQTPSFTYRLHKFIKRNKLIVTMFVVFISLISLFIVELKNQRDLALGAQQKAEVITDILLKSYSNADPTQTLGNEVKAIEILKESTKLLLNDTTNQALIDEDIGLKIAEVYYNLGGYKGSDKMLKIIKKDYNQFSIVHKQNYVRLKVLLLSENDQIEEAFKILDNALRLMPESTMLLLSKGTLLKEAAKLEESKISLTNLFDRINFNDELYYPVCSALANTLNGLGKFSDSILQLQSCLQKNHNSSQLLNKAKSLQLLGLNLQGQKQYQESTETYMQAYNLLKDIYDENHIIFGYIYSHIGSNYIYDENYPEALKHHKKALKIKVKVYGNKHQKTASTYYNIGYVYFEMKKFLEAERSFTTAVELMIHNNVTDSVRLAFFYKGLGKALLELKEFNKAEDIFKSSIKIFEEKKGTYIYRGAEMRVLLAKVYYVQNKLKEAKKQLNIALPNMYIMHKKGDVLLVLAEELEVQLKGILIEESPTAL